MTEFNNARIEAMTRRCNHIMTEAFKIAWKMLNRSGNTIHVEDGYGKLEFDDAAGAFGISFEMVVYANENTYEDTHPDGGMSQTQSDLEITGADLYYLTLTFNDEEVELDKESIERLSKLIINTVEVE